MAAELQLANIELTMLRSSHDEQLVLRHRLQKQLQQLCSLLLEGAAAGHLPSSREAMETWLLQVADAPSQRTAPEALPLRRTPEEWSKISAKHVAEFWLMAEGWQLVEDAQADIALLASALLLVSSPDGLDPTHKRDPLYPGLAWVIARCVSLQEQGQERVKITDLVDALRTRDPMAQGLTWAASYCQNLRSQGEKQVSLAEVVQVFRGALGQQPTTQSEAEHG